MKQLWTGQIELLTPPTESGDTRCFTNVVAWAEDGDDFRARATVVLEEYGWFVVNVENSIPIADCHNMPDELTEQVERAGAIPEACVYGTLHYFTSRPT